MAISSINFKPIKASSERHNERLQDLDYVIPELTRNNESWKSSSISSMQKHIESECRRISGRKLQKNAEPIREAVVNLNANHSMDDLKRLGQALENRFGIQCFQIHIHRDEGKSSEDLNYHAHMLFSWQNKATGKTLKLNRADLSQIQDLVAETLQMQRGELRENSNRSRLEAVEYKVQQESIKLQQLQQQNADLEQKKNTIKARIALLDANGDGQDLGAKKALSDTISDLVYNPSIDPERIFSADENDLSAAISILENEIHGIEKQIASPEQK